jgi:ribosomal protein S18 acetylase RimI-like enzyme
MVVVRFARRADATAIAVLARAFTTDEGAGSDPMSASEVRRRAFGPRRLVRIMVAVVAGRVVGYAMIYPGYEPGESSPGLHLEDLIVARGHRRKGVGRALMAAVVREAKAIDAGWVTWFVRPRNDGARAFYRALDAKPLGSIPLYIDVARRKAGRHRA